MVKITKVYTRRGDKGMTDLVGGIRISKTDIRLEAYGTIDELSSHLGLLVAMMSLEEEERAVVLRVQNNLFNIGTHLATDQSQTPLYASARLPEGETALLEQRIDAINAALPQPQGFVLPGGTMAAAQCHVCRTVCRRAERRIVELRQQHPVDHSIECYINRLSDFLFVLSRHTVLSQGDLETLYHN